MLQQLQPQEFGAMSERSQPQEVCAMWERLQPRWAASPP